MEWLRSHVDPLQPLLTPAAFTAEVFEAAPTRDFISRFATSHWVAGACLTGYLTQSPALKKAAAYGRHNPCGGLVPRGVGFTLFYAIGVAFVLLWYWPLGEAHHRSWWWSLPLPPTAFLWLLHVVRRLLECLFVHHFSGTMSLFAFVSGATFYVALPGTLRASDAAFSAATVDGQGDETDGGLLQSLRFCAAAAVASAAYVVALAAMVLQWYCHLGLRRHQIEQRRHGHWAAPRPRSLPAALPFRLVVCPHYTAEIVLYFCLAVLHWIVADSLLMLLPALFTALNLSQSAMEAERWLLAAHDPDAVPRRGRRNHNVVRYVQLPEWLLCPRWI